MLLDFPVQTRTRFSLRDKRLFEISEVEIARVNCHLYRVIYLLIGFQCAIGSTSDCRSRCRKFKSQLSDITSIEIDHEIISIIILPLSLIRQAGQLSITGEVCVQELVNCLED